MATNDPYLDKIATTSGDTIWDIRRLMAKKIKVMKKQVDKKVDEYKAQYDKKLAEIRKLVACAKAIGLGDADIEAAVGDPDKMSKEFGELLEKYRTAALAELASKEPPAKSEAAKIEKDIVAAINALLSPDDINTRLALKIFKNVLGLSHNIPQATFDEAFKIVITEGFDGAIDKAINDVLSGIGKTMGSLSRDENAIVANFRKTQQAKLKAFTDKIAKLEDLCSASLYMPDYLALRTAITTDAKQLTTDLKADAAAKARMRRTAEAETEALKKKGTAIEKSINDLKKRFRVQQDKITAMIVCKPQYTVSLFDKETKQMKVETRTIDVSEALELGKKDQAEFDRLIEEYRKVAAAEKDGVKSQPAKDIAAKMEAIISGYVAKITPKLVAPLIASLDKDFETALTEKVDQLTAIAKGDTFKLALIEKFKTKQNAKYIAYKEQVQKAVDKGLCSKELKALLDGFNAPFLSRMRMFAFALGNNMSAEDYFRLVAFMRVNLIWALRNREVIRTIDPSMTDVKNPTAKWNDFEKMIWARLILRTGVNIFDKELMKDLTKEVGNREIYSEAIGAFVEDITGKNPIPARKKIIFSAQLKDGMLQVENVAKQSDTNVQKVWAEVQEFIDSLPEVAIKYKATGRID